MEELPSADEPSTSESDKDFMTEGHTSCYRYHCNPDDDPMPLKWRHIRSGPKKVREDYKVLVHKLKSTLHMSDRQVQGAIVHIANDLFGRKQYGEWKIYKNKQDQDCNTLPDPRNNRTYEPYIEAMILASIVEEIMTKDSDCIITYSNDGSSVARTGQSFPINGKQRTLPTFGIITESKETLKELETLTMSILAASAGYRYTYMIK